MATETIELRGHIIDSLILPRVWDAIMDLGGNFDVEEMRVGRSKTEPSYARMRVIAPDDATLDALLSELQQLGATILRQREAQTERVELAGVLPDAFYSTTNLPTQVYVAGRWLDVEDIEMDVAIVVDRAGGRAFCRPMHEAQVGDEVGVGDGGIKVTPIERARSRAVFGFMQSAVGSERVNVLAIQ